MDIFAHGLWAAAAGRKLNEKRDRPGEKHLNLWRTAFWGILPDIFAFTPLFIWLGYGLLTGSVDWSQVPKPQHLEPAPTDTLPIMHLVNSLYSVSHSLVTFTVAILLVWLFRKYVLRRPAGRTTAVFWEMGGWLLHILIDIPTHTYQYFPTPILWPFSAWRFKYGVSWHLPWFMILNYSALALVYLRFWWKDRQAARLKPSPVRASDSK